MLRPDGDPAAGPDGRRVTLTSVQATARGERGQPIVQTAGLRKTFRSRRGRKVVAVEGLDLIVTSGGIHGYLGPNGSGKTTTIRMLLGLIRPDSGTMSLFGLPVPEGLPRTINRIGAVVEQPRLFPGVTGRDNLRLLAIAGGIDERRVAEVLDQVGLHERGGDRVKGYSLGMKQRLALAATLLRKPDLLILDEPTNGLDPAGIREIRELMRSLADQGVTILVSSHILSELQQVVDHVTIINKGRLLASGPVEQILGESRGGVSLTVADSERAKDILTRNGFVVVHGHESMVVTGAADPADITRLLAEQGLYVSSLRPSSNDLESAFLQITGENRPPDAGSEVGPPTTAGGVPS
jgi:ABC-type multidrug transport system ATPase subunit